jgi:hypothetical protein
LSDNRLGNYSRGISMAILRLGLFGALILVSLAPCSASQAGTPEDIFTISVAPPTPAKDVQVRYFFTGEFGGHGSSETVPADGNKLLIKTGVEGKSAKTFKAIAYAPGCQLVTISVDDLTAGNRQGDFHCLKLPTIQLHGRIDPIRLGQRKLQVEALYVCHWAMPFFGIKDGSTSPLELGSVAISSDGSFTLELPDFTADPTWPSISKDAELMFYLRDPVAGKPVGDLITSSRSGNLQVATNYPEVVLEIPIPEM